jgi:HEAT repeat protein
MFLARFRNAEPEAAKEPALPPDLEGVTKGLCPSEIRNGASRVLAAAHDTRIVPDLLTMLSSDSIDGVFSGSLAEGCLATLAEIDSNWRQLPQAREFSAGLAQGLGERRASSLSLGHAMDLIAEIGDGSAIPYLVPLLDSPDEHVRAMAAVTLARLGYRAMAARMCEWLADPRLGDCHLAAVRALGLVGDPATALPSVLRWLDPSASGAAGDASGEVTRAKKITLDALRRFAVEAVGLLADGTATDCLLRALADPLTTREAIRALGRQLTRGDAAVLVPYLDSVSHDTREEAGDALAEVGFDPTFSECEGLSQLGQAQVRGLRTLGLIGRNPGRGAAQAPAAIVELLECAPNRLPPLALRLARAAGLSQAHVELAREALGFVVYSKGKWEAVDLELGTVAVERLSLVPGAFTTAVLRGVARKQNIEMHLANCFEGFRAMVDFGVQRKLAETELVRREDSSAVAEKEV